jgi:uroporphyrinogen III methyltransferase/synthase
MGAEGEPRVHLVGAGPGDPGLLTVRAVELLAEADLVLYDQLVPRRVLGFARPGAELVCVRELPGPHTDKYPHAFQRLLEAAAAGQRVVRLKGGDPLIFGRGGEEAEALREAGLRFEIVPGVTAAFAAAADLDLPLTHRKKCSAVALVTGHELPSKPGGRLDWEALAKFPGTLAVYMGIARLPVIVAELVRHGKDPATPAAVVERASTGAMRRVIATLTDIEQARRHAGLEAPGLVLIGEAVADAAAVSESERRPLFGRRVLVTRPAHQAGPMLRKLERLGAVPSLLPTVAVADPADFGPLDAALDRLPDGFDWVVFTSANGVDRFFARLFARGRDVRAVGRVKLAAIGPKTADALRAFHLTADVVPAAFNSEGLVDALRDAVRGQRVLLARADRGRELLRDELGKVAAVEQVVVYSQVDAVDRSAEPLDALRRGEIEFVTLSSSNIARGLLAAFDDTTRQRVHRGELKLVCISPETGHAVRALGYPVAGEATTFTEDGLIDAVRRLAGPSL